MKNINIILASSNKGKIKEIQSLLPDCKVIPYSDILGSFEIAETGSTFKENATIKAKTIHDMLLDINYQDNFIVISDDSGISVPVLNGEPGIYSARYAKDNATDVENLDKLISKLKQNNISKTKAFYTACLSIAYNGSIYTTHGWMYGDVIDSKKGDGGFGYDPMFIPNGFDKTLGELDYSIKKELSHRTKALNLALIVIKSILK